MSDIETRGEAHLKFMEEAAMEQNRLPFLLIMQNSFSNETA